jgi:hypothetical protein
LYRITITSSHVSNRCNGGTEFSKAEIVKKLSVIHMSQQRLRGIAIISVEQET